MTDHRQDPLARAAKRLHDAIDSTGAIPADGKGLLHDLTGRAEGVAHGLAERAEGVAHGAAERAEDLVHVAADRAEDVVHAAADAGRDLAETAGIAALEASDQLRRQAERRTRTVALVGAGLVAVLTALLVASRRR